MSHSSTSPAAAAAAAPAAAAAAAMDESDSQHSADNLYLAMDRINAFYKDAALAFRNLHRDAARKSLSLAKFTAACASNNDTLPRSLKLTFADKANFPTDEPYTAEREQLRALQAETEKKIQQLLLTVKNKEIANLAIQTTPATFIATQATKFATLVDDDSQRAARAPAMPADALNLKKEYIVSNFKTFLDADITAYLTDYAEAERNKELAAEKSRADNLAAQATVLGDSSAETINQLVAKQLAAKTGAMQRQIEQLQAKLDRQKKAPASLKRKEPAPPRYEFHPAFFQHAAAQQSNVQGGDRDKKKAKTAASRNSGDQESD
jgi:predicted nucleic acid-binding protein